MTALPPADAKHCDHPPDGPPSAEHHTTSVVCEGDWDRCGECNGYLRAADPRLDPRHLVEDDDDTADIFDATNPTGMQQLPAVMTQMTPDMFRKWVDAEGDLFMVLLPARASFVIKVPQQHNAFFVSMMQQVKFALGPEVQAVRMNVVRGEPGIDPGTGTADEAPPWAQPAGREGEHTIHEPEEHVYRTPAERWPDNDDGSCGACGTPVDGRHADTCEKWLAMIRESDR